MKKSVFIVVSLFASFLAASETESNKEIEDYAKESVQYLEQSFATLGLKQGDLISLTKELSSIGLGKAPPSPPWHRELNEEEKSSMTKADIEAQKSYLAEAQERVSRMGKQDFEFLKSLDGNGDLELQEGEAEKVIFEDVKTKADKQLEVDQNGDRKLAMKEYIIGVSVKGEVGEDGADWHQRSHFKREDLNGDEFVDESEIIAYHASSYTWKGAMVLLNSMLIKADSDNNEALSEEEFKSLFKENFDVKTMKYSPKFPVKHEDLWGSFYWSSPEKLLKQIK